IFDVGGFAADGLGYFFDVHWPASACQHRKDLVALWRRSSLRPRAKHLPSALFILSDRDVEFFKVSTSAIQKLFVLLVFAQNEHGIDRASETERSAKRVDKIFGT